ncbi:MAG: hypothetical protein GXP40_04430 [Chloroflexi bacterium]|nr:hypothetical protein [Chloroflexota bacterium]
MQKPLTFPLFLLAVLLSGVLLAGCSGTQAYALAPLDGMPLDVQNAPAPVREAYQFAVANPEVLKDIPCYCGCGGMGHTSNYSCYVADENADGSLVFEGHALGCSICVDITQDAMRMIDQGKTVPEIRAYVDQTYSRFGPSNMP